MVYIAGNLLENNNCYDRCINSPSATITTKTYQYSLYILYSLKN